MIDKTKIMGSFAAALLAGAVLSAPAFAQHQHMGGGGGGGGGGGRAAISGGGGPSGGSHWSGGGGRSSGPSGHWSGGRSGSVARGPSYSGSRNYSFNRGSYNRGDNRYVFNDHRRFHHRRDFDGGFFGFGWGGPFYDDWGWGDYAYYGPDCYVRRVHFRHHWVWRRYCY